MQRAWSVTAAHLIDKQELKQAKQIVANDLMFVQLLFK